MYQGRIAISARFTDVSLLQASTVSLMGVHNRSRRLLHNRKKSFRTLFLHTYRYKLQLCLCSMRVKGCSSPEDALRPTKDNMSSSSRQHLDHEEHSNVRYEYRNEVSRARSAMTGLVPRQTRSPSAITFQTATRTGHSGIHEQPAHGNVEQLEPRISKHSIPSERRPRRARKRAFDPGPNDTKAKDPRFLNASKSWSGHHSQDRALPATEEYLNTPEKYDRGAPKLPLRHDLSAVVGTLARAVVDAFSATKPESEKASTASYRSHFRKRSRMESWKEVGNVAIHSDWEESGEVLVDQPLAAGPKVWPCPFFVKDRKFYASCLTRHCLSSMSDVRQHLILMHRLPLYCSVCYETFTTVRSRNIHMRKRQCVCLPPVELDGITYAQMRKLEDQEKAGSKVTASQHEQWYAIWRTVFSQTPPPPSPFSFTEHELEVYKLRRFWNNSGKNIVSDVLKERGLQDFVAGKGKNDLEVLYSLVVERAAQELLLR